MHTAFADIDPIYRDVLLAEEVVTDHERIHYCQKAIDKAQLLLETTRRYLSGEQRRQLIERITAAQREVKRLRRTLQIKGVYAPMHRLYHA